MTDTFLATLRGAHRAVFRARVVAPGQTGVSPVGTEIPIIGGDVTFDTTADVASTLDLTTNFDWPGAPTDLGTPYGQEIYIERGVEYGGGTREYVGLGYFRIDTVEQDDAPRGNIKITGSDRMANVRDGRALQPVQYGAGASVGAVLDNAIGAVVPGLVSVYDWSAYSQTLGSDHIMDTDRLKFVKDIVAAYGKVAYFDYEGRLQVKSRPDPKASPVWTINHGRDGVLVTAKRQISRDGVYNAVVASGEPVGSAPAVLGIAYDVDPTSPTYFNGPFGRVPMFYTSSFLTTNDQCYAAAVAKLQAATGLPYIVTLGAVPNPALEGWDVVAVTYSDTDNVETHILDRITYSLSVDGAMGIDTRKQFLS
ncbi:DUF5047 domain-containing protein [Amycolatopsis sp. NPDC004772]